MSGEKCILKGLLICAGLFAGEVLADAVWTGAAGDNDWTNTANWENANMPDAGENVFIPASAVSMPSIPAGTWPSSGAYGAFVVEAGAVVTCLGDVTAVNEASGGTEDVPHGIGVTINCASASIEGTVSADLQGFDRAQGPSGSLEGAAHGGPIPYCNGMFPHYLPEIGRNKHPYGSYSEPTALGSGGNTTGSCGGGAIKIAAAGDISVDGAVTANGGCRSAGGSIWLAAGGVFSGSGVIEVLGDITVRSARTGAGGRISITCDEADWSGSISAASCYGFASTGSEGTLWAPWLYADKRGTPEEPVEIVITESYDYIFPDDTPHYWNIVSTNGVAASFHAGNIQAGSIFLDNGSQLRFDKWCLSMAEDLCAFTVSNITIQGGAALALPSCEIVNRYDIDELVIGANSALYTGWGCTNDINEASGGIAGKPHGSGTTLHVRSAVIDGTLSASGRGFTYYSPSPGKAAEGASHGGVTKYSSIGYGRLSAPTALGSAGSADNIIKSIMTGGGALKLEVEETLSLEGLVCADATTLSSAIKSAGGSVWIQAGTLTGSGTISANGWCTTFRPGGGGRIAVEAVDDSFSGTINVYGTLTSAAPNYYAGPGTIFLNLAASTNSFGWGDGSAVTLASDYSNSAGTPELFPELLVVPELTSGNSKIFDEAVVVERCISQWNTKTHKYSWVELSAYKFKEDDLPNTATYTISNLPVNKKCRISVNGDTDTVYTDAAGVLTFTAQLSSAETAITVDASNSGLLIMVN